MNEDQPQFKFWAQTLELQLTVMQLVKSLHQANFELDVISLTWLMPWVFAMDHINYVRWLSVHIHDMCNLHEKHSSVYEQFCAGSFVVTKTQQPFSSMALDQLHEQLNAQVKGD